MSLRQRKKDRTREALADAALELFAARGFDATTVDQIAEAAGVSRRTFFRYFRSKEAVVFPDRERRLEVLRALLAEAPAGTGLEAVRRGLMLLAREYTRSRDKVILQQRIVEGSPSLLAYDFELDKHWEAVIADALGGRGNGKQHRHARLTAGAMMGIVRTVLREWYRSDGRKNLMALGEEAFELLRAGVGEKGADR
jgi:AcrR family transcriptional regulator